MKLEELGDRRTEIWNERCVCACSKQSGLELPWLGGALIEIPDPAVVYLKSGLRQSCGRRDLLVGFLISKEGLLPGTI